MNSISYYPQGVFLKKGIDNPPSSYLTFKEFTELHSSSNLKTQIESIRALQYGSWQYKNAKKRLPCVLMNKFAYNLTEAFQKETSFKPFDVDLKDNSISKVLRFKKAIKEFACFVVESHSGGIKFFLKINFNTKDKKEYRRKYDLIVDHLENKFDIVLDKMQGNIKQPYFLTYQKDAQFIDREFNFNF